MSINLRRLVAVGAAATVAAGFAVAGATGASAATIGTVTGSPTSGTTANTTFNFRTSAPCPAPTDTIVGTIDGPGWSGISAFPANQTNIGDSDTAGIPIAETLTNLANSNSVSLVDGTYTITMTCQDASGFPTVTLADFVGQYTVTGSTFAFAAPVAPASTTTLSVSPASPQTLGTPVTLTANVASSVAVAGSVQFKDGATNLGAPVAVAGGSAALTTSALTGGSHSLTAEFIPANPANIAASTSAAVPFTINAPAQATTVTLSSSPAAPTTADVVSLTATMTPANAVGTVTFKEGSTTVGSATVSGGVASVSLTGLTAGTHTYTAEFAGNAAVFLPSTSAALSISVTAFAGVSDSENITTTIPAGTLTITAGGPTVDLGTLEINPANTLFVQSAAKDINPVTVTDTRAGNLGWNVNGVVGDFTSGAGDKINSENLGWFPSVVSQQPTQSVTKGADVAAGNGVAVGATTGAGLKTPRLLASAATGGSVGTAVLSAKLALQAPTTTVPGVYNSTLTLTAI
jgi:Bacterial Ig-like domain (group 3)